MNRMKVKIILSVVAAITALSIYGCGAAGKEVPVTATSVEFAQQKALTRTVKATRRDTIEVTLPSTASTGFKWELVSISDPAILEKTGDNEYILPESSKLGAYGQEILIFKPLGRGSSIISLAYSQQWEGGIKNEWTMNIAVKIR